jgi:hypothetical protein
MPGKNSAQPILIHIGYPKTASTWAQTRLFTSAACGFWNPFPHNPQLRQLNKTLIAANAFTFDARSVRAFFDSRLAAQPHDGLVPVISAESLVGLPYAPGQFDGKIIAERLFDVFPDSGVRILAIIREQKSMTLSRYSSFIRGGGWKRIESYLDAFEAEDFPRWIFMYRDYLLYDLLIAHYHRLFGKERVLVLPYEMLRKDPLGYARRIVEFAGSRVTGELPSFEVFKPRMSAAGVALRRRLNPIISRDRGNPFGAITPEALYIRYARLFRRLDNWFLRRFAAGPERRLKDKIARLTGDYYRSSNRRTSELIGVDLANYGYDV